MASSRVSATAVDWAKAFARAGAEGKNALRTVKSLNDKFLNSVNKYPESMPSIDFEAYRKSLADPKIVDVFEKEMKALSVPYPEDKENLLAELKKERAQAKKAAESYKLQVEADVSILKEGLELYKQLPMRQKDSAQTGQMMLYYFPETMYNTECPEDVSERGFYMGATVENHEDNLKFNTIMNVTIKPEYLKDKMTAYMLYRGWLTEDDLPEWYLSYEGKPPTAAEEEKLNEKYAKFFEVKEVPSVPQA